MELGQFDIQDIDAGFHDCFEHSDDIDEEEMLASLQTTQLAKKASALQVTKTARLPKLMTTMIGIIED